MTTPVGSPAEPLAVAFREEACRCLTDNLALIEHCAAQLNARQLWWRPHPAQNSIGNLLLHLTGNLRQWLLCGLTGDEDRRDRPAEFVDRAGMPLDQTLAPLQAVIRESCALLRTMGPAELIAPCRVQGFDLTKTGVIFDSVSHFRGHAQEIVSLTRQQLGDAYQFHWTPQSPEQG